MCPARAISAPAAGWVRVVRGQRTDMAARASPADAGTIAEPMVETTLNYLGDMVDRPFFYVNEPPPGIPRRNTRPDRRRIAIHDARDLAPDPSLDEEGFLLAHHETAVANLYDPDAVCGAYYREIEELVRSVTAARRVVAFDHNVRCAPMAARREHGAQP